MAQYSRRNFLRLSGMLGASLLVPKTAAAQTHSLRFIHITDTHMDLQDTDSIEALRLAMRFIAKRYAHVDFVLFGGDNFNNNVAGYKDAQTFLSITNSLPMPAYFVAGNKEVSPKPKGDPGTFEDFFKHFVAPKKELTVKGRNWALEKNGYLILGLNSNVDFHNNGLYTQETIRFAKDMLRRNLPTVILNHHPYLNYWHSKDSQDIHKYVLNNAKEVVEELTKFPNLVLTLSGHKHIDNVSKVNDVLFITTRGFVRPLDLDQYPMRYIVMENGKVSTQELIYTIEEE